MRALSFVKRNFSPLWLLLFVLSFHGDGIAKIEVEFSDTEVSGYRSPKL